MFLRGMGAEASGRTRAIANLDEVLSALVETSRRAWPSIDLDPATFLGHLGRHVEIEDDLEAALRTIRAPELYLACACALGNRRATAALEDRFLCEVDPALRRMRLEAAMVDEVKQIVREKLLVADGGPARIADYGGRGPLEVWVRVVAVRAAMSQLRLRDPSRPGTGDARLERALTSTSDDPELELVKRRYAGEFKAALEIALKSLPKKERTVLRLHFVDGLNIEQIGTLYRVHRATVARWIARSRDDVLREVRESLSAQLKLTTTEFKSLVGDIESQIYLSLGRLLESDCVA
jgi:RNA polymerase sigma-70 factor (ECF subfamily)